jgi:DNA-binding transcriptional regulator of glucitol operon
VARPSWTSRRAVLAHAALLVWVPGCAVATRWQVGIALSGDLLGWVYSVMWPCFAVFGVLVWWHLARDDPETVGARGLRRLQQEERRSQRHAGVPDAVRRAEAEDPELAAYNAYLAELARSPGAKSWRLRR